MLGKGSRIIETLENYSITQNDNFCLQELTANTWDHHYYDEKNFWKGALANPEKFFGSKISLYNFVVSNWVARIPGLFWMPSSNSVRKHLKEDIAIQSKDWIEFHPPGKSKKVLGGIGTLLLPPSENGSVIMSVSSSCNASLGIPILVFPEVLDSMRLKQGDLIQITDAVWQPHSIEWSKRFASTKDIARGYLVIDKPDKIRVIERDILMIYHPFSIMEYQSNEAVLYDFVFVTADSKAKNTEKEIESFFTSYAKKEGRYGEYLINPNMVKPSFQTRYQSASELQSASERAQLILLNERIRKSFFNEVSLDALIQALPKNYETTQSIKRLAQNIGVSPGLLTDDTPILMSSQLLAICLKRDKVEELIDRMIFDYPQIFN